MTTDPTAATVPEAGSDATAGRLEALRQRRTVPPAGDRTDRQAGSRARRRRHAATGACILAGGLSVSLTLGLVGAMARAADNGSTAANTHPPTPVVAVVDRSPRGSSEVAPAPEPVVHPTDATPVTSSHSS
jgi:hypothetical protein